MVTDDDCISYLVGEEPAGPLDSDERATLDDLRHLLADPAIWAEPSPGLEDRIVVANSATGLAGGPLGGSVRGVAGGPTA